MSLISSFPKKSRDSALKYNQATFAEWNELLDCTQFRSCCLNVLSCKFDNEMGQIVNIFDKYVGEQAISREKPAKL